MSPAAAHNMDGCEAKRCVPDVASAFACQTDTDCPGTLFSYVVIFKVLTGDFTVCGA